MRKIVTNNLPENPLQRMEGGTIAFAEDGRAFYRETYYLADPSLLQTGILPQRGVTQHPDFAEAVCANVFCRRTRSGGYEITVEYNNNTASGTISIGAISDDGILEVMGSVSSEPIETHPDFSTFAGTPASPANSAVYDSDDRFAGWEGDSSFAGIDSYLVPSVVARHTYPSNSKPSGTLLGNIGTIQSPSHSDIVTPGGRNWLLSHVSYRRSGDSYEITEEYTLSGPGGWNSTIY